MKITVRNLDDDVKRWLHVCAENNGGTMEEEARVILRDAIERKLGSRNLGSIVRDTSSTDYGVDLAPPLRVSGREPAFD